MSVKNGIRFGTKPHQFPKSGDWKYIIGKHPDYEKVRKDPKLGGVVEAKLRSIIQKQEKALAMTRYLLLLFFGGHAHASVVDSARGTIKDTASPSDNLNKVRNSLPPEEFNVD